MQYSIIRLIFSNESLLDNSEFILAIYSILKINLKAINENTS